MDLDDLSMAVSCLIDETVRALTGGRLLRQRGPVLADSKVLTIAVVGEHIGRGQAKAISGSFRLHQPATSRRGAASTVALRPPGSEPLAVARPGQAGGAGRSAA
jgi:hypothetical protein